MEVSFTKKNGLMFRFDNEYEAWRKRFLFVKILRMRVCCADGYDNAYMWRQIWKG